MVERVGLVQVYTGDGKGKTTAALGQALRSIGRGLKVVVIEFMKESPLGTGELEAVKRLAPDLVIKQFGGSFLGGITPEKSADVKRAVAEGLRLARDLVEKRGCDILVLDEISHAVNLKVADVAEVLSLIESKPPEMELILTGRDMPKPILEKAHLVTEMRLVKHHFEKGIDARKGIEY